LSHVIRKLLYRYLRQGRRGSHIAYSFGAYLYWLISARRLYVGTRIVEIPWVLKQLHNHAKSGERILQVGDVLLYKALQRHHIELVDMDAEEKSRPGLKVHKTDIRSVRFPQGYFDIAISISTLEHIGIHEPKFPSGDKLAVDIISEALKPGGLFLLTVPFGKPVVLDKFRVYDKARLDYILGDKFSIDEEAFFIWNKFKWQRASSEEAGIAGFLKNNPSINLGVALVKAMKVN